MDYKSKLIHNNLGHTGGVANYKFNFLKIPNIENILVSRFLQSRFRFEMENLVVAVAGN